MLRGRSEILNMLKLIKRNTFFLPSMMMIWKYIRYSGSLFLIVLLATACESSYTKLVKSELAKGVRQDSVLLGIKLGDTRNDFYGRCFDLNKEHLIAQGDGGS